MQKRPYNNPFQGKKAPLPLSGLFLFDPSVDMKLQGHPMRKIFTEMGKESLFKRVEKAQPEESLSNKVLLNDLIGSFFDAPFVSLFEEARDGNEQASAKINAMGPWETFLNGRHGATFENLPAQSRFILEIERACKEPFLLIQANRYSEATELLETHPVMQLFLWPQALTILSSAKSKDKLPPLQVAVALEIRLSLIALVDATVTDSITSEAYSNFSCLVPSCEQQRNPTSLFFYWLKKEVGASKIEEIADDRKDRNLEIDITTLKRWSSGSHHPSQNWLSTIAQEVFGDAQYEPLWNMYWASIYLNFLGYMAQTCRGKAVRLIGTPMENNLMPWPNLPFGHDSIESWFESRYPIWIEYHRNRAENFEESRE